MKRLSVITSTVALVVSLLAVLPTDAKGQSWLQFAHPNNPHPGVNGPICFSELFTDSNAVIQLPLLVVLMDFNDVTHRADHTLAFWEDLVFGTPRTGARPSVAEIVRENTNGRLLLVPAVAGDMHGAQDGVVGWIASPHNTDDPFWDPPDTGPGKGRAEGIIVADPFFNYNLYDNDGPDGIPNSGDDDGIITVNELVVLVVFANDFSCDQHDIGLGHTDPLNCTGHAGGKVTPTDPQQVPVDQDTASPVSVFQKVAGVQEISHVGVVAHEFGHQVFNLGDLYHMQPHVRLTDGYIVYHDRLTDPNGDLLPTNTYNLVFQLWDAETGGSQIGNDIVLNNAQVTSGQFQGLVLDLVQDAFDSHPLWLRVQVNGTWQNDRIQLNGDNWYPPGPVSYSIMASYPPYRIPHGSPWAKLHLGFAKPQVITHDGSYTLYDAETERNFSLQSTQPEAIVIYDPMRPDPYREYFILENRNEPLLDDQGLTVWLIDETTNDWRKVVRLIRRGGYWAPLNHALWDGVDDANGYDLNANSIPRNTNWTDRTKSYIEIYDISLAGPAMTFKVRIPPIFVDWNNDPLVEVGSQDFPFDEVDEAIDLIPEAPRTIRIAGGSYPKHLIINTACTLKGWRNGNAVIGK